MQIIPFDKREGQIWINGSYVEWNEAKIHVLNHGLHYASCVFEGLRIYNGRIFKLKDHIQRLYKSANILDLKIPYSETEVSEITKEIITKLKIENGYIRPVVWRGSEMMAIAAKEASTNIAIAAWPWPSYFSPDVLLNGITFLKYFRKKNSRIPILMLTADGNLERKTESFTSGCDDYLIKPFEPFELVLRINKLLNPRINLKQTKKSFFGDCEFDFNSKELRKNNILINLTYSEQKLIELLSKNLNQEISREKIANELNLKSNFRSIDVIITRLRKKISFKNESLYLRTIRGKGYMLISDYD